MSRFFINRPIFAWVISIMVMLGGLLAIKTLPVSQYPPIAPPQITINAMYPGASAQTVQDTVTQVIEQKLNGIDNLIYMSSTSDSAGAVAINLTFKAGTDPNIAQVQVQNKLQLATPLLPQIVQRQGIQVVKSTKNFLMIVGLVSEDGSLTRDTLTDYLVSNVQDIISRTEGVGEVTVFGSQNAMRIWLDPAKLNNFHLTTNDVIAAIQAQNAQVSAGQFGGSPAVHGQQLNATITARTLLQTPEQFNNIILRTNPDGSTVKLKDVAEAKVGTENYDIEARYKGKPLGGMAIRLAAGANALDTGERVKAKMEELSRYFPAGMKVVYPYDTTPFVKISIKEVVKTLVEAVFLVFIIMFLFLQNIRATLIPTIAVPVVLLGTMGVLAAAGFSINTLTMFALVIVIGLLVDDAIVVVENVERIMSEEGLSPHDATIKSMGQITSALWGIATVLSAVFLPMAFFGGSTGVIYRQFSITIISAMILSVLVAQILTPALCSTLLKPVEKGHTPGECGWFCQFFRHFNKGFDWAREKYEGIVGRSFGKPVRYLVVYGGIVAVMVFFFLRLPTAFLPDEDQGFIICQVQLPAGATKERTIKVIEELEHHFLEREKKTVEAIITVAGFSFAGRGQNMGLAFVKLKDWELRPTPDLKAPAVAGRAMAAFSKIKDGMAFAFSPPAVVELGQANGFDFMLQDRSGLGHDKLMEARNQLLGMAMKNPKLMAVRPNGQDDSPQFKLDIDDVRAGALGVSQTSINEVLSTAWGSSYVNDFIENGRVKKVYLQADARYRMLPEDIGKWYVRNNNGEMVPFSAFATAHWQYGSPRLERYNGIPSVEIMGQAAPGVSTGEAMAEMEKMAAQLPAGIGYEWTGLSYEEKQAGAQAPALYAISLLVVFLAVAALYESWTIPFVNLLMLPLGLVGAVTAVTLRMLPNDVYLQIGLLTTVGLSTKNAILIIQFIKEQLHHGHDLVEATLLAVKIRLRPVIMTSLAFFFGTLPLALTKGAGAAAQNAIGTAVTGGLLSATFIDLIFIPFFFVMVSKLFAKKQTAVQPPADTASEVN
ncbi:efflux RND transporter permease subunit [Geobacter sulfurreducens]|uniref:Efflux pump, RND family, inner membrane protein n=1 Tax=Geobacter sulfurreducens (strain ATCC 51573 / DSM 12127 / PCA) TaxID=243231 RepID=Q749P6_GEOSL|nr:efflux RND transporter permease subunit [Geobacter sulfurreducens]AAR36068.1 efflux pump, RND family, inner membrane protein [Geobacter sulfurreducens PCA]UAC03390.1 efflux RND transporter permease subunit [Geobacter sulfurreducens]HBB68427.1 multidrug efflux RND transporter permease subunit [Geobacter sulfurreducens]HCD95768.1 multidrug efflux RND transporter permease subunit [Geobacter sulfurreducens]